MKEREENSDPYWQEDLLIGEGKAEREIRTVRMRLHQSQEHYFDRTDIVPIARRGEMTYFHGKPYFLLPNYTFTVGLYPKAKGDTIGEVLSSEWDGMRHQEMGNAQAWFYPEEKILVIWECYLYDSYRQSDPASDDLLKTVWAGFEKLLLERLPEAQRIAAPGWEPVYEKSEIWQEFLKTQGYNRFNERAFIKEVALV